VARDDGALVAGAGDGGAGAAAVTTLDDLVRALEVRGAASEWVAVERSRHAGAVQRGASAVYRSEIARAVTAIVHRDSVSGRGSAGFSVDDAGRGLDSMVDDALVRASAATGPGWRMAPAAAAARVEVGDRAFTGEPRRTADELASRLEAAAQAAAANVEDANAVVVREDVAIATSQGVELGWTVTDVVVRARVLGGDRGWPVAVSARRYADLDLPGVVAEGRRLAIALAEARPTPAGAWPLVLGPRALLAGGGLGLLEAFAAQADAATERIGLGRYRVGQPVAIGAVAVAEPLTVVSDGALPFGPRSAPLADDASPVRRFHLVDRGVARGLALDHREAALRRLPPNGGVRNLVIEAGTALRDELVAAPALLVEEFGWVDVEARTGAVVASIALGTLYEGGSSRPVTGGMVRFDAIAALALARRSAAVVRRGPYEGPDLWRLPPAAVE
jgi:predicted Zn-dependent protease